MKYIDGRCKFKTMDKSSHFVDKWDLLIAFPPCTYLSRVGNKYLSTKATPPEIVAKRWEERANAAMFFMRLVTADCEHIAIENPVGYMNTHYRKPDQIISPYMWACGVDDIQNYYNKETCLWLKRLPKLTSNGLFENFVNTNEYGVNGSGRPKTWVEILPHHSNEERQKNRSKTPIGIANAMAEQWGDLELY